MEFLRTLRKGGKCMKKITVGILAHVDAGKTTLSEAMLFLSGTIRKYGRVDHKDTFLDTNLLEKERGITIFSKQAIFTFGDTKITLLDTPGHVDFSAETERTLGVLDYAILVINGTDGIQSHTQTLWRLLAYYHVPTFLFINKTDLQNCDPDTVLHQLKTSFGETCLSFSGSIESLYETIAVSDEDSLTEFLETESLSVGTISRLIRERKIFPCYFGSALRLSGVEDFLKGISLYTTSRTYPAQFGAKVYKISYDTQGTRLTHLKITGGSLKVKDLLRHSPNGEPTEEKIDQIRLYSGAKYDLSGEVSAGDVCCVTGPEKTFPGEGIGLERSSPDAQLVPVLSCKIIPPKDLSVHELYTKLSQISQEDPQLHIVWDDALHEIHLQPMGDIQLEILQKRIYERFGIEISYGEENILYKETILEPVEGMGHFEPLRHYAEVHLLLEPGERGSGLRFASACSEDFLDRNWQRLILTHLREKEHVGPLTGSPITDMRITLVSGRAHLKHTEGGDFREATYRAVRHGLRSTRVQLLEPYYEFLLEIPSELLGRAVSDLQAMGADFRTEYREDGSPFLSGKAPVSRMRGYQKDLRAVMSGKASLSLRFGGYGECLDAEKVIQEIGYDPDRDLVNTADSVFCSHGAGFIVKWDEAVKYMHLETIKKRAEHRETLARFRESASAMEQDKELMRIFENTYGPIDRKRFLPKETVAAGEENRRAAEVPDLPTEFLLVDGYNIIFAWDELKALAKENLETARAALIHILSNYQGFRKCNLILVFDAYKVHGGIGAVEKENDIFVIYTREAETADMYIEKTTFQLGKNRRVRVATSDNLEQLIISAHGSSHVSAQAFREEVTAANEEIRRILENLR